MSWSGAAAPAPRRLDTVPVADGATVPADSRFDSSAGASECNGELRGRVVEIQKYAVHDGPGIRTVVFLKGCPLRCVWCQNPESLDPRMEMSYAAARCISCGACTQVCPRDAIRLAAPAGIDIERSACARCGSCADECVAGAMRRVGRDLTVSEVLGAVLRDREFYERSGGGLTVSGGEPFLQHRFAAAVLRGAKRLGLHTVVETCGQFRWRDVELALRDVDLVYFDLKVIDDAKHRTYTGVGNRRILANARHLVASGSPVVFRCPLVPGHTATSENVAALIGFLRELDQHTVHLLPYHSLGEAKLARLGSPMTGLGLDPMGHEAAREIANRFEAAGIHPVLGGS